MSEEQAESLAKAHGKHPIQSSEKEELELLDEEFLDEVIRHQRGLGKNQHKEETDRNFGHGSRNPGNPL